MDQDAALAEPVDIGALPELSRLAEEVRNTGRPRLLRRDGEPLAMIVPIHSGRSARLTRRKPTARDLDAFRAAAGSWSDVDVDRFLADAYAARDVLDDRPPVAL